MMARGTRGLSKVPVEVTPPSSVKRKRRGTPTPPPSSTPNIVPPSPNSLSQRTAHIQTGPTNGDHNGVDEPEGKRAKITLKLKASKDEMVTPTPQSLLVDAENIKTESTGGRGLSRGIREALSLVIKEMAIDLPPPINKILTLWLPPDFVQKPENTLAHVLKQDSLTWETLVDTLHVFCKNLLVPCNYPNPVPPTSQFHLPVPTLPSHYPYHPIYSFCAGLHTLLVQIAPPDAIAGADTERWGLVQKVPNQSSMTVENGDWFTAGVDPREVGSLLTKLHKTQTPDVAPDETLLAKLAAIGDRLGYANAVGLQSASANAPTTVRTLNESVLRKASLKAQRWKELRAQRSGGFGNSDRSVRVPPMSSLSFTPSFGATYDSNHYFAGYYDTMSAMHERARIESWTESRSRPQETKTGYRGLLSDEGTRKDKGKAKETVEDILAENNALIEELQGWQELRVQKGNVDWLPEREQTVAQELLASLTRLAAMTGPSSLLENKESAAGLAHRLAQRLLQNNSPSIRGVLDPRRPQAIHDNLTVRPKSASAQPLGGASTVPTTPSPTSYPPRQSTVYQPPRQQPAYAAPSTPYRPPTPNYTYTSPFNQVNFGGSPAGGVSNTPPPVPHQNTAYRPPLAGPSGLRQSFGPGSQPQALQYTVPR